MQAATRRSKYPPVVHGKPTVNHPFIVELFEQHCVEGNTPRTFIAKLYGGVQSFMFLCRTNHGFKAVNEKYKRKEPVSKFHARRSNQAIPPI